MNYYSASDRELLESCCLFEDLKAYNELVTRYSPKLYAFCKYYLNDTFLAEEIALDVLFWLWKKRQQLEIPGNVSAYLHRAARNAVISHMRKQSQNIVSTIEKYPEDDVIEQHMADYAIICQEGEDQYKQLLAELSPQRKEVFVLSREGGFSYKEIAQKTNLSVNTIENYISSALKHFRKGILPIVILLFNQLG